MREWPVPGSSKAVEFQRRHHSATKRRGRSARGQRAALRKRLRFEGGRVSRCESGHFDLAAALHTTATGWRSPASHAAAAGSTSSWPPRSRTRQSARLGAAGMPLVDAALACTPAALPVSAGALSGLKFEPWAENRNLRLRSQIR